MLYFSLNYNAFGSIGLLYNQLGTAELSIVSYGMTKMSNNF